MSRARSKSRAALRVLALVLALAGLAGCPGGTGGRSSDDDATGAPAALVEVPPPDAAAMEPDVASIVRGLWDELAEAREEPGITDAALADAHARYGLACFANGLEIPAEAAFENATRLAPEDPRWIYVLALLRESQGRLEEAERGLERVLELRPDDLPALLHLGDVRLDLARVDAAREAYRRALDVDPESAAAHYGLGRVAAAEGDDLVAASHYESALARQPEADRLNYLLGLAYRNLGDAGKAEAYLAKRGSKEPRYPDPLFDEIREKRARVGGLWGHMRAASQAFVDGAYDLAVEEYRKATEAHPDDPRSWQSLGMALQKVGDRAAAREAYETALALDASNAVVLHDLALLDAADGRHAEAVRRLRRAIEIDPRLIEAHAALARVLAEVGRLDASLASHDAALALDPQSGALAVSRAEVLARLGRTDEALAALADAASALPLDPAVRTAYGSALADAGRTPEALEEIGQALVVAGDDGAARARAHYALGRLHLGRGEHAEAAASFGEAVSAAPDHDPARHGLARALGLAGRFDAALAQYETVLERTPGNDGARVEAAGTALLLGRPARAKSLLEPGAARGGASPRVLSALARLLALADDSSVHDPARALDLARQVFEQARTPQHAETLALCLAAAGRFDEAVRLQERLLAAAERTADAGVRDRLAGNLERYRQRRLGRLPLDAS